MSVESISEPTETSRNCYAIKKLLNLASVLSLFEFAMEKMKDEFRPNKYITNKPSTFYHPRFP